MGAAGAADRRVGFQPRRLPIPIKGFRPVARKSKSGLRLKQVIAFQRLSLAIRKHERGPFELPFEPLRPAVTEDDLGKVIVIRRDSRTLLYYNGLKLKRSFRIATWPAPVAPPGAASVATTR